MKYRIYFTDYGQKRIFQNRYRRLSASKKNIFYGRSRRKKILSRMQKNQIVLYKRLKMNQQEADQIKNIIMNIEEKK